MADLDRGIDQTLVALKKGAQLLKYGRKGKPKFCPFKVSNDGSSLIWTTGSGERSLKLSSVLRIIPGQRTAVFRRYLRPEKDYLSFSLIYNNGKRSLDVICKDKVETEVWITGLKTLIPSGQGGRSKIDGWTEGGFYVDDTLDLKANSSTSATPPRDISPPVTVSPSLKTNISRQSSPSVSLPPPSPPQNNSPPKTTASFKTNSPPSDTFTSAPPSSINSPKVSTSFKTTSPPSERSTSAPPRNISSLEISASLKAHTSPRSYTRNNSVQFEKTHVALDNLNMQGKGSSSDVIRISVSSAPSTSSHGSLPEDCDALADVYIWGEVISGPDGTNNSNLLSSKTDLLLPRLLESNVVLDVHHIACGVRHAALVTRQGELFTWGEESGGRLGHGVEKDVIQPRLVESLSVSNVDFVACGEYHTCAITASGELYTWGDGSHNAGILGHGTNVSQWIPKRVSGPLEGLQVASVTCGPWHTALITTNCQLFTFGDGTFGVLGHGDRENVMYPREVDSLLGLRTVSVACGVWHTAAVVEVIMTQSSSSVSSGKLFTWGDGDKNRLGHGDKEPRLKPTCVPTLIDYNFHKVVCGHSLTVGMTTNGSVFTMGSTVYGQLGSPQADGKLPCLVEDKLLGECVEDISCGSYHVSVITSKNEVYSWGKGANGRLGHGDIEDKKTPTLIEALKDRHVKYIACGSSFTAAICLHKWVSGAEQSQCVTCRLAFGFTRKRHNCYNCGLVHCHSCCSRKALRAALAPNPSKPYRVCDSCYTKLNKLSEAGGNNRKNSMPRLSSESSNDRINNKGERRFSSSGNVDLIKPLDNIKAMKLVKKSDIFSMIRSSQTPSLVKDDDFRKTIPKPSVTPTGSSSRPVSPFSRKSSPPRSITPLPTSSGLSFSKSITDSLKQTNELLNQEVLKLRAQVEILRQQCEAQELELKKSSKKDVESLAEAAEEAAKSKSAQDVIQSLTAQLKDITERLPPRQHDTESTTPTYAPNKMETNGTHVANVIGEHQLKSNSINAPSIASPKKTNSPTVKVPNHNSHFIRGTSEVTSYKPNMGRVTSSNAKDDRSDSKPANGNNGSVGAVSSSSRESENYQNGEGLKSRNSQLTVNTNQVDAEWIEQYEPGVYITLVALADGTRDLKRVRFSRRRFGEHQAETWWSENRDNVNERYNIRGADKSSVTGQGARRSEGPTSPSSQSLASMDSRYL